MKPTSALAMALGAALTVPAAQASTIDLPVTNVSGNSATNAAIGHSQFNIAVSDMGSQVNFRVSNVGSAAVSIAQIYFDDRMPRLGASTFAGSAGVSFKVNGAPPNLPSGNQATPSFSSSVRFSANNPAPFSGINPGEFLDIKFSLSSGDFDDILHDLTTGKLRIGMHAIAFTGGGSESFVSGMPRAVPVPLPAPLGLAAAGLTGLAAIRRRR